MAVPFEDRWFVPTGRWLGWIGFSILLVAYVMREQRERWRLPRFWMVLAGLLAIHCVSYVIAFRAVDEWRAIWFFPISILEYVIFTALIEAAVTGPDR